MIIENIKEFDYIIEGYFENGDCHIKIYGHPFISKNKNNNYNTVK